MAQSGGRTAVIIGEPPGAFGAGVELTLLTGRTAHAGARATRFRVGWACASTTGAGCTGVLRDMTVVAKGRFAVIVGGLNPWAAKIQQADPPSESQGSLMAVNRDP